MVSPSESGQPSPRGRLCVTAFPSELGWMAVVGRDTVVCQLTFGHPSAAAALRALDGQLLENARCSPWNAPLRRRLQAYAEGQRDDFRDVQVDWGSASKFRRSVLLACRKIPYGQTVSYAELARKVGSSHAARAVGNCMAANRLPLLIPCHRVVCADGRLGAYSAPGGCRMKRRLLDLETQNWSRME